MDSWMDLMVPTDETNLEFQADLLAVQQQRHDDGQLPANMQEAYAEWNQRRANRHRERYPLNDHLFALIFMVLADLTENQRERVTSFLAYRGRGCKVTLLKK